MTTSSSKISEMVLRDNLMEYLMKWPTFKFVFVNNYAVYVLGQTRLHFCISRWQNTRRYRWPKSKIYRVPRKLGIVEFGFGSKWCWNRNISDSHNNLFGTWQVFEWLDSLMMDICNSDCGSSSSQSTLSRGLLNSRNHSQYQRRFLRVFSLVVVKIVLQPFRYS